MKTVKVAAAVISAVNKDGRKVIFATQRGYGDMKGGWEFPGGKLEMGETSRQALVREINEELDTEIGVGGFIKTVEFDYPAFHLSMDCFWANIVTGRPVLKEHEAARWVTAEELDEIDWLPADRIILPEIKRVLSE